MVLNIRYRTGMTNQTYKKLVSVDTSNYPEMDGLTGGTAFRYIIQNASQMTPTTQGYTSLQDEIMSQPTENPPFSGGTFYSIIG